jgi:hypothetical protein
VNFWNSKKWFIFQLEWKYYIKLQLYKIKVSILNFGMTKFMLFSRLSWGGHYEKK